MLESLLIQNYQPHEKFRIDFDPAITCLVGTTDVGKSSSVRALRWVCTNQPGGDAFVRHGTKGTTVKLMVDGHAVTRRRSRGGVVNEYRLDGQEYRAFGRGVPEPIEQLLNLGPVCWQGQHDAPYWFAVSPGEVSRQLNSIVNLGIIDETLTRVARDVNTTRTRLEVAEEALTTAKKESDELVWVSGFAAAVTDIEAQHTDFVNKRDRAALARSLFVRVQSHTATRKSAAGAAERGQTMVKRGEAALVAAKHADTLRKLIDTAKPAAREQKRRVPDIGPVEAAMKRHASAAGAVGPLRALLDVIGERDDELCQREKELVAAEKAVPKQCPTCGRS